MTCVALAGCGNKGPLVKPSDIPVPVLAPADASPADPQAADPAATTPAAEPASDTPAARH
ncbi:MAG: LPS translocon maturation chaperone LptM [Thermomonas sp.]